MLAQARQRERADNSYSEALLAVREEHEAEVQAVLEKVCAGII